MSHSNAALEVQLSSEVFEELNDDRTIILALLALVVYEHIITFEREVQVVWRREFSIYSVLLLVSRYCTLLFFFVDVASITNIPQSCGVALGIVDGLQMSLVLNTSVLAALRAFAISTWRFRAFIALSIFIAGSVSIGIDLYQLSTVTAIRLSFLQFKACATKSTIRPVSNLQCMVYQVQYALAMMSAACNVFADLSLLVVILVKSWKTWMLTRQADHKFSIAQSMLRDGIIYFLALLILNIVQILITKITGQLLIEPVIIALTSVLSSRFIINLRWQEYKRNRFSELSMDSFFFATMEDIGITVDNQEGPHSKDIESGPSVPQLSPNFLGSAPPYLRRRDLVLMLVIV
ncbi:hypothetical protein BDY19DRAFT_903594 [Irpex rosettiformis]|uniref:Uncharacterized protein n=1 Tax=Irpex rosettiformis TaxID=378272 RepID=A0ACB8UF12_9APHY|nr:hypothetical protein BDY19DRAFT_903594 [Irpex rosettiformis]